MSKDMIVYKADNGETVLFSKGNAWHVHTDGLTDHYKAVDGDKVKLTGKVVFISKSVKKVTITQNQYEIVKRSANERQYITFDFVNLNEVRLGTRVFLTEAGQSDREKRDHKRSLREQKSQALAEKKAAAIQKKADKRMKKEEKRISKKDKNNIDMFDE